MSPVRSIFRWPLAATILLAGLICGAPLSASTVRGTATIAGVVTKVELRTGKGLGELRHRAAAGADGWETIVLYGPNEVLPLLADARLAFLWPAIDSWAGADLVTLRDAALVERRRAWEKGRAGAPPASAAQGVVTARGRGLMQYVQALHAAGRDTEGADLLATARAASSPLEEAQMTDWSVFSMSLASARLSMRDRDGAIDLLRRSAARLIDNPLALNVQVALAGLLAEQGLAKEALATIEQTRALLTEPDSLGRPVPGALLKLDWIRACALNGLGRTGEARALVASVRSAAQPEPTKASPLVPTRNFDLLVRAEVCARDDKALAETLSRELRDPPIASQALLLIQPSYTEPNFDDATLDRARAQVPTGPAWRILPSRYRAALTAWRNR